MENLICISPFKELRGGEESIYDYIDKDFSVPDKVIAYLRVKTGCLARPGIYEHPFKVGMRLLGPFKYTDGKYIWDSDLWKYVLKYHVTLPQEFVDYVMSSVLDDYFIQHIEDSDIWPEYMKPYKKKQGWKSFLPNHSDYREDF